MKTLSQFCSLILILLLSLPAIGENTTSIPPNKLKHKGVYTATKWEIIDLSLQFNYKNKNPFLVELNAELTAPDGTRTTIPAFYNGGREWILRFSGNQEGNWTLTTKSPIKRLNEKMATIKVTTNPNKNVHGAIQIPKNNPQHFYYEDGTPYFMLAFECDWLFALDYKNTTALPKSDHLMNLVQKNGFNQVVMNVFSYDVSWVKDQKLKKHPEHEYGGSKEIFPFLGNNDNPDFSQLNIEFFKKFDRTIALLNDKQLVSHLMIYVWNKMVNWPEMYSDADNLYFDYVVKRYQAYPNIMWDISKEALYYGRADDKYILERIERLRKLDGYKRLVSVHDFEFCSRHPEKIDYLAMQSWTSTLYNQTKNTVQKHKKIPVFNIEHGGYEDAHYQVWTGDWVNAEACLRRNYFCLFGGAYTTYYWQDASWNVVVHNPYEQPENIYKPKFEYFKHMADFFTLYPFSSYTPRPNLNASGYCLANKDETYLFYVPKENYKIKVNRLHPKNYKNGEIRMYKWFNTLTGEYSKPELIKKVAWDVDFISPWQGKADVVLISWIVK